MKSNENAVTENLETEVVVIGGGGGGLPAAVAAGELGAKVILLEKRHVAGGNAALAGGILAVDSHLQRRNKILAHVDEIFKRAMAYAHWKIDPSIMRAFLDKSGDTVKWLEEKGVLFQEVPHFIPNEVPRLMHWPKGRGAGLTRPLVGKCKELGVSVFYKTAAKKILVGEDGAVAGVLALSRGKELRIGAKAVIVATGGYAGNKEMLKKHYADYTEDLISVGLPHMGDGVLMAAEIGAAPEGLGMLHLRGPYFRGPKDIVTVAMEPNTVWVNKKGERYVDEGITFNWPESANALNRQPGKIAFSLFDEKIKRAWIEDGLLKGYSRFPPTCKMTGIDKKLEVEAEKGGVKIANTWKEIGAWIGMKGKALKATIDEYNESSDRGYDGKFFKDRRYLQALRTPPFCAVKCYQSFLGTLGGIKITCNMEVLNRHGEPIPGLYAAGNDTGGWEADTYGLSVLPGSAYGFAVNSGRMAGENAAKFLGLSSSEAGSKRRSQIIPGKSKRS